MLVTSCERPVSFAILNSSVPSPVPVLAVTVHCALGAAPTGATAVIDGLVRPEFAWVKLPAVSLATGLEKGTSQVTEPALVGLVAGTLRSIKEPVVSGRSTGVQVAGL